VLVRVAYEVSGRGLRNLLLVAALILVTAFAGHVVARKTSPAIRRWLQRRLPARADRALGPVARVAIVATFTAMFLALVVDLVAFGRGGFVVHSSVVASRLVLGWRLAFPLL
jgi:hypothetical protein